MASARGGRWSLREELVGAEATTTLYTSCVREGALAELSYHYAQLTPFPSKPIGLHRLGIRARNTVRLLQGDLTRLGVVWEDYGTLDYAMTQKIGAAVAFLGFDGLLAPSARWLCENLMLFPTNRRIDTEWLVLASEEVALLAGAREHGFVGPDIA